MNVGRRDYVERRAARIERLEARAAKAHATSEAALGTARRIGAGIPFGQPILIGHHSERRHRRDAEKIDRNMRKGVEASKEASRLERRAAAAEANTAISSDDPDAIPKLKAKLEGLLAVQERMKLVNGLIRKHSKAGPDAIRAALLGAGVSAGDVAVALTPDMFGKLGFPGYALSGGTAEMTRIKKRIALLQSAAEHAPIDPVTIGDVRIVEDDNRIQIHFVGKPSDAIRAELKQNGFRWAPSVGAWQRMTSQWALDVAKRIAARVAA
jgi:hypothetical protein